MDRSRLLHQYLEEGLSMKQIASSELCSVHKVEYWLKKYEIPRRKISDAVYLKHNGLTDPFRIAELSSPELLKLYGIGIGIYWGEGNKKSKTAVRMGNTDVKLVKSFILFLHKVCGVTYSKMRYSLQLFSDVDETTALEYWQKQLNITRNQIMPTVNRIKSGKIGTYKIKNKYGVMTVYVFNRKLRDWLNDQLIVPR
jgi:hypothetical protein